MKAVRVEEYRREIDPHVQEIPLRINTNGKKEYRTDLYERTAERFGIGTKSGGIDAACEFSMTMLRNLERAAEHPDMTEDLAEILSTADVTVEHRVVSGIEVYNNSNGEQSLRDD